MTYLQFPLDSTKPAIKRQQRSKKMKGRDDREQSINSETSDSDGESKRGYWLRVPARWRAPRATAILERPDMACEKQKSRLGPHAIPEERVVWTPEELRKEPKRDQHQKLAEKSQSRDRVVSEWDGTQGGHEKQKTDLMLTAVEEPIRSGCEEEYSHSGDGPQLEGRKEIPYRTEVEESIRFRCSRESGEKGGDVPPSFSEAIWSRNATPRVHLFNLFLLNAGKGKQVWKRAGAVYEGEWKQNVRDGYGILSKLQPSTNEYVNVYSGTWKNDKKEGFGTRFYISSARYEGEWVENERSGWGRMNYENGDVYEGEWLKDKPHGQGVLWFVNENRYEGSWKDGKKDGHGRFFYTDKGQQYEGFWVEDIPRCGTVCDYDRKHAHTPALYPIPPVMLQDVKAILKEGCNHFCSSREN